MVLTKKETIEQYALKAKFLNTYQEGIPSIKALIDYIQLLHDCGGPSEREYAPLTKVLTYYRAKVSLQSWKNASKAIAKMYGEEFINSIPGHAYLKPYGYAGDFEIIDKMYLKVTSENPSLKNWDLFYHQQAAARAVRNRKSFFKTVLRERVAKNGHNCEILDVASGPCRDLLEFFEEENAKNIHVECVEADLEAILHATRINHKFLPKLTFHNQNIFRYTTDKKYDLIWSAGLFDYFNDTTFVKLVSRFTSWVKPGGEIIIGNFAVGNPSEGYMELFLDWYLYHRSPEQLVKLAQAAGIANINQIIIDQEEVGVNLFMRIKF